MLFVHVCSKKDLYLNFVELGSTISRITNDANGEFVPHLEITEVVLVHCNIVNKDYLKGSRVLHTFVPNRSFGRLLLYISLKIFCALKTLNSEISHIEVWFTYQNTKLLKTADKINFTLVID